ncbi:uncharacterized protein YutE (UPF0331/DUF86 family) [Salinibacter ruber]|jgi:uncharacterized protein YutE (UPF0331/DUF86 family)|uniref:hypothetical protein n=1 Tax=Salinibacter ruber TaxID=146919 RepID=UPI00216897B1|nr:hypothetical protein [Salinibacter ruber]MCS3649403.1 uncharacterized protein YutE (UPF0331/DUF86 family) [Salinibacter ruber]MCS3652657.1 uncharacterized protein YutE (UPF0331/DUF86 family) [Salinibacter ruber]
MSDQSPLFVSSTELIAHSIELFTQGNERKYKFIILHLANSIELILKDRLIDEGQSIYSSPKHTIGIRDAFRELKKQDISIPERPVIELLIDDRNTIQHRFGFPDADTVYYYIDEVLGFFDRFLEDEYDVDLVEVLRNYVSEDDLSVVGLIEQYDESEPLDKLYELSPEASILRAYTLLERRFANYLEIEKLEYSQHRSLAGLPPFEEVLEDLTEEGYVDGDAQDHFSELRELRNRAAHSTPDPDSEGEVDWGSGLEKAKSLIQAANKAHDDGFFQPRQEYFEEFERRRREQLERVQKRMEEQMNETMEELEEGTNESE